MHNYIDKCLTTITTNISVYLYISVTNSILNKNQTVWLPSKSDAARNVPPKRAPEKFNKFTGKHLRGVLFFNRVND